MSARRRGHFCKHVVAAGLAVIDSAAVDEVTGVASTLEATVQAMDVDELRELVLTLAHRDGEVRRMLEVRATAASGDDTTAKAEFEAYVRNALDLRGFVDYRESYAVAQGACTRDLPRGGRGLGPAARRSRPLKPV